VAPLSQSTASKTERIISGPSFLGLSTPGPASDRHTSRDPLPPSSGNLDYLLEDEEEPKRGAGKAILILLALALALGFGYLRWKQGGFDWLTASSKKPAAATSDVGQNSDSAGSATPARPPEPAAGRAPASQDTSQSSAPQNTPSQSAPSDAATSPNTASPNTDSPATAPQSQPNDSTTSPDSAAQPANSDSQPSPPAEAPAPKAKARKPVPAAKPPAAKPYDQVAEAERYIYGRGGRQDCDHGMRLMKSAAEQSNPKAMISMGALYSTGTCTPRDLPTAYRWFALALHKQPDNQALQEDLKSLWEKMTQPERQLAIKLSQ
jgi:hypothetical protein